MPPSAPRRRRRQRQEARVWTAVEQQRLSALDGRLPRSRQTTATARSWPPPATCSACAWRGARSTRRRRCMRSWRSCRNRLSTRSASSASTSQRYQRCDHPPTLSPLLPSFCTRLHVFTRQDGGTLIASSSCSGAKTFYANLCTLSIDRRHLLLSHLVDNLRVLPCPSFPPLTHCTPSFLLRSACGCRHCRSGASARATCHRWARRLTG